MNVAPAGARPGLEACGRAAPALPTLTPCSPWAFLSDAGHPQSALSSLTPSFPAGLGPGDAGGGTTIPACGVLSNAPPKDVYVLISGTCEYVTIYGRSHFTGVIK